MARQKSATAINQINATSCRRWAASLLLNFQGVVGLPRLERGTYCLGGSRSIHLSYRPVIENKEPTKTQLSGNSPEYTIRNKYGFNSCRIDAHSVRCSLDRQAITNHSSGAIVCCCSRYT